MKADGRQLVFVQLVSVFVYELLLLHRQRSPVHSTESIQFPSFQNPPQSSHSNSSSSSSSDIIAFQRGIGSGYSCSSFFLSQTISSVIESILQSSRHLPLFNSLNFASRMRKRGFEMRPTMSGICDASSTPTLPLLLGAWQMAAASFNPVHCHNSSTNMQRCNKKFQTLKWECDDKQRRWRLLLIIYKCGSVQCSAAHCYE